MKLSSKNIGDIEHESIIFFQDQKVGLKGFIAIHNTNLGPATGGTRYLTYTSEKDALKDALLLSKAMTYKCALAGVPYGGGKAVIMAQPEKPKTKEYLQAYAKKIQMLGGNFYTGEDVGMDQMDIGILAKVCPYINGLPEKGGSPSPWAALGVFYAMQAGLEALFGNPSPKGRTFAIKGLGHLGFELCRLLYESGGIITVADINPERVLLAQQNFPTITIAPPESIHQMPVDVYAPCALGGEFNHENTTQLKCKIICGGANNQLTSDEIGLNLFQRNILYLPDYLVNAGGLINVVGEWNKEGYSSERVHLKVKNIQKTAATIIALSKKENRPMNRVADEVARSIFMNRVHRSLKFSYEPTPSIA
jgi:leucine dehydrogenase